MSETFKDGFQICTKCKKWLPSALEYYHRDKNTKSGFCKVCRECRGYKFGDIQRITGQTLCIVFGCEGKAIKKNYCNKHYQKWRKYGDPLHNGLPVKYQPAPRKCSRCGKWFTPKTEQETRPKQYCSVKCSKSAMYLNRKNKPSKIGGKCPVCGKTFIVEPSRREVYCSYRCYLAGMEIQKRETALSNTRTCAVCAVEFLARTDRDSNIYCSVNCWTKGSAGVCDLCGKEFVGPLTRRYCSKHCRDKDYWEHTGKYKNRLHQHERRAAIKEAVSEKIDCIRVFERDNWCCQICGEKVNPDIKYPHPKCATVDHIIPIKKGGNHTYDNVQLAHLTCNNRKSDRNIMPNKHGQLMLV